MTQQWLKFENPDFQHRYLHKKLLDSERVEFELYLLDNPQLTDTLEIDQLYQQTLIEAVKRNTPRQNLWHWLVAKCWATPGRASLSTLAACACVALLSYGVKPSSNGLVSSQVAYLETVRSVSTDLPTLTLKADSDVLALLVQTYFAEPDTQYNVHVVAKRSGSAVLDYQVTGNEHGELLVVLPRHKLTDGEYTVQVTGNGQTTPQEIGFYLTLE